MIKRFLSYYSKHKKVMILDLVAVVIYSAIDIVYPLVTKQIINGKFETTSKLLFLGASLLILYSLRYLFRYIVTYYGHVLGINIETDMRQDLFEKFESLDYSYFDDKKSGELLTNLTSHLFDISEASHHVIEDWLSCSLIILGSFSVCMIVNYKLTLIVFMGIILVFLWTMIRRKRLAKSFRNMRKEQGELGAKINNSLAGIQLTKAFNNEDYEIKNFKKINQGYYDSRMVTIKELSIFHSTTDFLVNITNLLLLISGGLMYLKLGPEFLDELIMFFLYVTFLINPIKQLANTFEALQQAWSGYERFYTVITTNNTITNSFNPIFVNKLKGNIKFNNVSFRYKVNTEEVLNNFNLEIKEGSKVAIVGETGVGKSTISKIIPRFYDVSSGEVLIDNINVKDYELKSLRDHIGHVQQDVFIFYGSIKENILYGNPSASDEEVRMAAKKANISDFIESLPQGYDTLCGERGIMLSGGQKQRISIARIFLKNPEILILDEATSALDNITEKLIQQSFDELSKGKTTILIAHRLTTVQNADKIIVLGKEGIIEQGSHNELMNKKGYYYKMYEACKN